MKLKVKDRTIIDESLHLGNEVCVAPYGYRHPKIGELLNMFSAAPELLEALNCLEHAVFMGVDADPELYINAHRLAKEAREKALGHAKEPK